MSKVLVASPDKTIPRNMSKLTIVNADAASERYMVIDRDTCKVLRVGVFGSSHDRTLIFAPRYQHTNSVILMILDDDKQYAAEVIDGIKLEATDANIPVV
ncbi:hypothetical protein [Shewanella algae]|uniref:hypothetical protein n=1 Tax=Shewanella algae TaxID=38313 RepID=UPI0031F52A2D